MTSPRSILHVLCFLGIVALIVAGLWIIHGDPPMVMRTSRRPMIMNTPQFELTVVVPPGQAERIEGMFRDAEAAARVVEERMNVYNPSSELSEFNAAPAQRDVPLTPETMGVLQLSADLHKQTDGAFDVTILPLMRLWKQCGQEDRLPSPEELHTARMASQWKDIRIEGSTVRKTIDSAEVDLGGIAKGVAIDRACDSMIDAGAVGGIVNIGGDVRCFGHRPNHKPWRVGVRNPFRNDPQHFLAILAIESGAVCTSGNYERFETIGGEVYSHIKDPRTLQPADLYPSVTVVAPQAAIADAWATALSVLGPAGFHLLPEGAGIEAMIITGSPEKYRQVMTDGFAAYLADNTRPRKTRNASAAATVLQP